MKKVFILSLMAIVCQMMQAFEVDGIYYTIIDGEAVVINSNHTAEQVEEIKYHKEFQGGYGYSYLIGSSSGYKGNIVIPDKITFENKEYPVTAIAHEAFCHANLLSIQIPCSVKYIGADAFSASGLTEITFPNSVLKIGDGACSGLFYLNKVVLPEKIDSIPNCMFYTWEYQMIYPPIKEIVIPKNVKYIGPVAFYNLRSLTTMELPDGLEHIAKGALSYCKKLSTTIPNTVKHVGYGAFWGTPSPTNSLPENLEILEPYSFYAAYGLKHIDISKKITDIPEYCFAYCLYIETVSLQDELKTIGDYSFLSLHELRSIILPSSLSKIGKQAFYECNNLRNVFALMKTPCSLTSSEFGGSIRFPFPSDAKLYVPIGCAEAYKAAGWGEYFPEIIEMDEVSQRAAYAQSITGVSTAVAPSNTNAGYFNLQGQKLDAPQKGINILRTDDGKARKVYIK